MQTSTEELQPKSSILVQKYAKQLAILFSLKGANSALAIGF